MRDYWINDQSALVMYEIDRKEDREIAIVRFPRSRVRNNAMHPCRFDDIRESKRRDIFKCHVCKQPREFKSATLLQEHLKKKHNAAYRAQFLVPTPD